MKHNMRVPLAACIAFVLAVPSARGWQVTPQPFSADMSSTAGGQRTTGKFYLSPPKSRMDVSARGRDVIVITDSKTQTGYMLMPQQHMYMETHGGQPGPMGQSLPKVDYSNIDPTNPCSARPDVTCKKLGTETMNGRVCDKWEFTDKNGGTSTSWIDQKLHFPIKTVTANGTVEFSNVKEGAPDASVFEIPAGYRKLDLPAMGGRPSQ